MIKQGVLFYTNGHKPVPELVPALFSFWKHNPTTNVCIVLGPETPTWFEEILKNYKNPLLSIKKNDELLIKRYGKVGHWCNKALNIQNSSPFKITLYYDCDHVFLKPLPDNWPDEVWKYGLSTGISKGKPLTINTFLSWSYYGNVFLRRNVFTPDFYDKYNRVNGGCVGYAKNKRGRKLMNRWMNLMHRVAAIVDPRINQVGDESALSITLNYEQNGWLGDEYSINWHPYNEKVTEIPEFATAMHFSRESYKADDMRKVVFQQAIKEVRDCDFLCFDSRINDYLHCSKSIREVVKP